MTVYLDRFSKPFPRPRTPEYLAALLGTNLAHLLGTPRINSIAPRRMFAAGLHSEQALRAEKRACDTPVFGSILGSQTVKAKIERALASARKTPNSGLGGDIPGNGSEHGFYAGSLPLFGAITGPLFTSYREAGLDFDPAKKPLFPISNMLAIHTHQSRRGRPGLSRLDLALTAPPPRGMGVGVVAIEDNGTRYCWPAGR